ncbi:MAG: sensor histidine kinase [Blastocatellia bacterium]|nr:sensor histidine kinase [Blastocatellia bacterium]
MKKFSAPMWAPRLLWKLSASYLVTTLAVVIIYLFVDIQLEYNKLQSQLWSNTIASRVEREIPRFVPLFNDNMPNTLAIEHLLFRLKHELEDRQTGLCRSYYFALEDFSPEALSLTILDLQGNILVATSDDKVDKLQYSSIFKMLENGLSSSQNKAIVYEENSLYLATFPIINRAKKHILLIRLKLPKYWWQSVSPSDILGDLETTDLLYMALMSLTFGYIIARQLTKRLEHISTAADMWARGDFSIFVEDGSADEIGVLMRRLNRMAEELKEVVALRQRLARLEERTRLARDLHDTIKQRLFALSMQISAAQVLLKQDPNATQKRLVEAEALVYQIQRELVTIIEELRPKTEENLGLAVALREIINDWSRQSGIKLELYCEDLPNVSSKIQSELIRILQEALANTTRHSQAKTVLVCAKCFRDKRVNYITLTVQDDGIGFDLKQVKVGMGLQNMRERSELLPKGYFKIDTTLGSGTFIEVRCVINDDQK